MEEQVWALVEKALAGNASQQDIRALKQLLALDKTLHAQVNDFLENYIDPDPQIQPWEKRRLLQLLQRDEPPIDAIKKRIQMGRVMRPSLTIRRRTTIMTTNYFKTTLRNLWKSRGYSAINIVGLAVGLASFLTILLYLNHELSYDTWDEDLKRVYKVSIQSNEDIRERNPAPLATLLKENAADIEAATSISPYDSYEVLLSVGDNQLYQRGLVEADSSFFKVFPYRIVQGDVATALDKPNAMVITEELAAKLFGEENPIGKTISLFNSFDCEVTAVMQQPDKPSHLEAEAVYRAPYEKSNYSWQNYSYHTYVKTKVIISENDFEQRIDQLYYDQRLKEGDLSFEEYRAAGNLSGLFVDAAGSIHNFPKHGSSNIATVSVLLVLAILLLLAGAINFSNLSIAASIRRAKEVGVKKVLGSTRLQLFWQFMGEVAFQCLISLGVAFLLLSFILPLFNREFGITLELFQPGGRITLILQIVSCLLFVIVLSGLYPALFLSRYNTAKVLKGDYSRGTKGMAFRNGLIVVQFAVSAFFIIGTVVISRQLHYMQTRDKGFSGEQVMRLRAQQQKTRDSDFESTRSKLLSIPGVQYVAKTTTVPGDAVVDTFTYAFKHQGQTYRMASVKVSTDYFNTLDIDLVAGRMFNESHSDQNTRSAIINETAARIIGMQEVGSAYITYPRCDSIPIQVVGVVRDFNVSGFETGVQPVVYTIGNQACMFQSGGGILVKLAGNDLRQPVAAIEQVWKDIEPGYPIQYSFLEDNFQQLFASHMRLRKIINFFGFTAIAIAVMGLFALTAFLVGQRTKEIGIRKVLGASMADIGLLVSRDFVRLVAVAVVIAIPVGWWAASSWLDSFAYRITLDFWMFLLAAFAVLAIAIITVGLQTLRAASTNPVDSLRDE